MNMEVNNAVRPAPNQYLFSKINNIEPRTAGIYAMDNILVSCPAVMITGL